MNIQSISQVSFSKEQAPKRVPPRKENVDRYATLNELYESEDRILAQNEALIRQQNQALANAMVLLVHMHKNTCTDPECNHKKD